MKIKTILSKQTTLFLIGLLTLSTLFLPLTTLRAATLTNGMNAFLALGQSSLTTLGSFTGTTTQSGFNGPAAVTHDIESGYTYVADLSNARVLVFDMNGPVADGMNASYVIGQNSFTTRNQTSGESGMNTPIDISIDRSRDRFFVADSGIGGVRVYDISGGVSNGMAASYVLGQADFGLGSPSTEVNQTTTAPSSITYDEENAYLFVGGRARVMVYDLSGGVSNGMAASYVLGQADFFSTATGTDAGSFGTNSVGIRGLTYDQDRDILWVADTTNYRTMGFDLSGGITNGMAASYVLGQPDFATINAPSGPTDVSATTSFPQGLSYDDLGDRLFVSEGVSRVLVYDLSTITNGEAAINIIGQDDFSGITPLPLDPNNPTADSFFRERGIWFDWNFSYLYVTDSGWQRTLVFDLTEREEEEEASSSSFTYTHPPTCTATFTPNTITEGESTTLSWNATWPTNRQNNYYARIPGEGLYPGNVSSIQMTPNHSTVINMVLFNLWGANFCEAEITVLDENGEELTSNNSTLTAGVSNSPIVRAITSFFASIFSR